MAISIIVAVCTVLCLSGATADEHPLKVSLYYESRCPYCTLYISKQLMPAFKTFSSNILIDLLPYGNAERQLVDGRWVFKCQHGKNECYDNRLQACGIQQACGPQGSVKCSTDQLGKVLQYIVCLEANLDDPESNNKCAKNSGLNPDRIAQCASTAESDRLLEVYGSRTDDFWRFAKMRYVPAVAINNVHNTAAEKNLHNEICKQRPKMCV